MFGKAMGAEVTAISHSPDKEADAKKVISPFQNVSDV
jgi:D-arabinose 1-dehydrogenase-like Zn-dependent alcohol dehydrogenase